jgi:hypothetical protein
MDGAMHIESQALPAWGGLEIQQEPPLGGSHEHLEQSRVSWSGSFVWVVRATEYSLPGGHATSPELMMHQRGPKACVGSGTESSSVLHMPGSGESARAQARTALVHVGGCVVAVTLLAAQEPASSTPAEVTRTACAVHDGGEHWVSERITGLPHTMRHSGSEYVVSTGGMHELPCGGAHVHFEHAAGGATNPSLPSKTAFE